MERRRPVARPNRGRGTSPLDESADALLERLGVAGDSRPALEAEANAMVRQAERALAAAMALLEEEGDRIG